MYLLAGLMGLMALGSVALVSVGDADDDPDDDLDDGPDHAAGDDGDMLHGSGTMDLELDGLGAVRDDGALEDGRSLFDRMGLINLPAGGPASIGSGFFEDAPMPEVDHGVAGPEADVLRLHGYRFDLDDAEDLAEDLEDAPEPEGAPDPQASLDYDPASDQLLIVFDDSAGGAEPELDMRISDTNPDVTEIRIGETVLARMSSDEAPPLSDIVLVGESDAAALGLTG